MFGLASRLSGQGVLLVTALVFCFILAYLASIIGLAPIVGAYVAGLILEEVHFRPQPRRTGNREVDKNRLVKAGYSALRLGNTSGGKGFEKLGSHPSENRQADVRVHRPIWLRWRADEHCE